MRIRQVPQFPEEFFAHRVDKRLFELQHFGLHGGTQFAQRCKEIALKSGSALTMTVGEIHRLSS
jgi:hypothetical protein